MNRTLGIIFTLAGAILLIVGIVKSQKKKDVVDIGPIHVTADAKEENNWMPYTGGLFFIGGVALLVSSKRSR